MKMCAVVLLGLLSVTPLMAQDYWKNACSTSKEYITTLNFLRDHKEFGLEEKGIQSIADNVSKGCTDSALRFIKATDMLVKASLPTVTALEEGQRLAVKSNAETENFVSIFKRIYLEKFFDLPASDALALAKKITMELEHDHVRVLSDFNELSDFCLNRKGLDLSLKTCSDMIGKIIPKVELERDHVRVLSDFNELSDFCLNRKGLDLSLKTCSDMIGKIIPKGEDQAPSIARAFVDLIEFMTVDSKGPQIPLKQAIDESIKILDHGSRAADNYILAFKFAISEKGLSMKNKDAMAFSATMASRSVKN